MLFLLFDPEFHLYWQSASKTQVSSWCICCILTARSTSVSVAITFVTKIRATFFYFITTIRWTSRISLSIRRVICRPPIGCPFPNITNDIMQTVFILWEHYNRRCARISIFLSVFSGKVALPNISPDVSMLKHEFSFYADYSVLFCFPRDRVYRKVCRGTQLPILLQWAISFFSNYSKYPRRSRRHEQQDGPFWRWYLSPALLDVAMWFALQVATMGPAQPLSWS